MNRAQQYMDASWYFTGGIHFVLPEYSQKCLNLLHNIKKSVHNKSV